MLLLLLLELSSSPLSQILLVLQVQVFLLVLVLMGALRVMVLLLVLAMVPVLLTEAASALPDDATRPRPALLLQRHLQFRFRQLCACAHYSLEQQRQWRRQCHQHFLWLALSREKRSLGAQSSSPIEASCRWLCDEVHPKSRDSPSSTRDVSTILVLQ